MRPEEMSRNDEKFARNSVEFTSDLLTQIIQKGLSHNVIFSPFSIQACLALAFAGAKGDTANEIAKVMRYVSNDQLAVAQTFQFVLEKYKSSSLFEIVNKIYVTQGRKIKDTYQKELREHYFAEAEAINFVDNVNAANSINLWVESKTNNKIKDLISHRYLDESTRLVLLNAIHFKCDWQSKFNIDRTVQDDFWINENESITIQYMLQRSEFNFGQISDLDCKALEMPFKDSDLSMLVLLPNKRSSIQALIQKMKTNDLTGLATDVYPTKVNVKIPKFKTEFSLELGRTLRALGLKKIFDRSADFSNMLEHAENLEISKVVHKAVIEVNEEGTEAVAATAMVMRMRTASFELEFHADHPFLYIIWNSQNIFFAGAFVNAPRE